MIVFIVSLKHSQLLSSLQLDIGNPVLDFDGYEDQLPLNHFILNNSETFVATASDLYDYPMNANQEFVLPSGLNKSFYPVCDILTSSEEYNQPVYAKTQEGKWLVWSPTINLQSNGPSINAAPGEMASSTLPDGGGEAVIQTGEKLKCKSIQSSRLCCWIPSCRTHIVYPSFLLLCNRC